MTRYAKLIVAVVGAIATWASTYYPDSHAVQQWVGLALALATAVSVYAVPNMPPKGKARRRDISEQGLTLVELLVAFLVIVVVCLLIGAIR